MGSAGVKLGKKAFLSLFFFSTHYISNDFLDLDTRGF